MRTFVTLAVALLFFGCDVNPTSTAAAPAAVASASPAPPAEPVFAPPPRLATSAAELAAVKAAPDFAKVREAAAQRGDALLKLPPPLPEGYAEWTFYYACPDDGSSLHAIDLTHHQCPVCKKIYTDDRTVAAYRCLMHYACDNAAEALGWAYVYTGDDKYVQGIQRVLLKYADDYHTYPDRLDRWGHTGLFAPLGGRRFVQSLDEAVGAVALTRAYDLSRLSPAWTDAQKKHVEEDFFRPTAASLLRFNQDINNHQTWYNAGLIGLASVLGDATMVKRVLNMRGGVNYQLENSIGRDGLWYEGSMAYHNYALQPMVAIADATRRMGLDVYKSEKLKSMITGPLYAAYPDGSMPVINDSDPSNISMFNWAFEWGWKTYHDPLLAQAAAHGDLAKLQTMLGPDAKVDWPLKLKSQALADAGLVFLRQGEGAGATCVVMDYGPHGGGDAGGHGHYDKLNICVYANGREWILDPGRLDYSHKEYKTWVKTTAAHNTVTLGGKSQEATTGKLLWLKDGETNGVKWSACSAEGGGAYPGAVLRRSMLLTDKMLVDVFEVQAPGVTQIDLLAHATAEKIQYLAGPDKPASEPFSPGDHDGYQHLTEGLKWVGVSDWAWAYINGKQKLVMHLMPDANEQLITCVGIGYNVGQKTPTLIRRRNAASTTFVAVYDLTGEGKAIASVSGEKGKPSVTVKTQTGETWDIRFALEGVTCKVSR